MEPRAGFGNRHLLAVADGCYGDGRAMAAAFAATECGGATALFKGSSIAEPFLELIGMLVNPISGSNLRCNGIYVALTEGFVRSSIEDTSDSGI